MTPQASVPRQQRTLPYLHAAVLEDLIGVFCFGGPELDRNVFMKTIYYPTRARSASGDAMVRFWKRQNAGKLHLVHLIQVSCAYCVQVENAMDNLSLARSYLMDAHLYLGMARAGITSAPQVDHLRDAVAKEALTANARHSVSVSVEPWHKTKAEATRLIRVLADRGESWATPAEAARAIAEEVEKFLATLSPRKRFQGPQQRDRKVAKWLREMPEACQLFASLRKRET